MGNLPEIKNLVSCILYLVSCMKIYTKTRKIPLYVMFIYRENALKAHQHISYCSILVTLKNQF